MAFLLDVILALLAVLIIFIYAKRGAVKSIYGMLSLVVAGVAAFAFGPVLGNLLVKPFFSGAENAVYDALLSGTTAVEGAFDLSALFANLPQNLADLISRCGVDLAKIQSEYGHINLGTEEQLRELARTIAEPVTQYVSQAIGCVAIFVIARIVMFLLRGIVKPLVKLPLLKQADGIIGGLLGVVSAFAYVWIICIAISAFVELQFLGDFGQTVVSLAETSAIFRFFCTLSPLDLVNIVSVFE